MQLPPEILGFVFGSLEKATLLNARLVCKSFEEAASPFLFDQIYISNIRADLEIANRTVLRFGHYVRTLVFASTHTDYRLDDLQNLAYGLPRVPGCCPEHVDVAWNRYTEQCAEWREVNRNGELYEHLCFVFGKIPRLQTITITSLSVFQLLSLEQDFTCADPACMLHKEFLKVAPESDSLAEGKRAWQSLFRALSTTKARVKNLISADPYECPLTPWKAFGMSQTRVRDLEESFQYLIKLELSLSEYKWQYQASTDDADPRGNVAKALAAATDLEQLKLNSVGQPPPFEMVLGGCRFSKLQSLDLSHIESTEEQLLGLLRCSPGLEIIALFCHGLTEGLWEHMARWMKLYLHLQRVSFNYLWGGLPQPFREGNVRVVSDEDVEEFVLRNGENPFTTEALKRKLAEREG